MASRIAALPGFGCRCQRVAHAVSTITQPLKVTHKRNFTSQDISALEDAVHANCDSSSSARRYSDSEDAILRAELQDLQMFTGLAEARRKMLVRNGVQYSNTSLSRPSAGSKLNLTAVMLLPTSMNDFRGRLRAIRTPEQKSCRIVLSAQLFHCRTPRDMLEVLAIVMTHPFRSRMAQTLANLEVPITRAWYRCRQAASDPMVLRCIIQYIRRFEMAGLTIDNRFYATLVKFGARCRDVDVMRRCLSMYKGQSRLMPDHMFRAVVAKCSIGRWGLGAIRNGHWTPVNLRQVLCGFDAEASMPYDERCHIETFLDRTTWKYMYAWIAVLGLARAGDKLWQEWQSWKQTFARMARLPNMQPTNESQTRGDVVFMEALQLAGHGSRAWQIFRESELTLDTVKPWVLLDFIKDAHLARCRSIELQGLLCARYGDVPLESGQPLRTICVLDACDSDGHAVISAENAMAMYACLKDSLGPLTPNGLIKGDTLAACTEARELHEAVVSGRG